MQSCQSRKRDKRKKTQPNKHHTQRQQQQKAALLSAISALSPAHAWKEAPSSATGKKISLGKQSLNSEFLLFQKSPCDRIFPYHLERSFPLIHQPFPSAADLPGGTRSPLSRGAPRAEPRPWLPPCSWCSSGFSRGLFRCWVSARGAARASKTRVTAGTEPNLTWGLRGTWGRSGRQDHFSPHCGGWWRRPPLGTPSRGARWAKLPGRAGFCVPMVLWTPNRAVTGAASVSPAAPIFSWLI